MRMVLKVMLVGLVCVGIFCIWRENRKTYPVKYGVSFSREYATWLGLDWQETYLALLQDLKIKYIRISAPWNEVEKKPGVYDFVDLDWQMEKAAEHNTKVVLVVGQKTPRWPECRFPTWSSFDNESKLHAKLLQYVNQVVNRYKNNPALEFWQVENEPFIKFEFGDCKHFQRSWTVDEINVVRSADPAHKIMVTDSGEIGLWKPASQAGDIFGTTLYRTVRTKTGKLIAYDWLPAFMYRAKGILLVKDFYNRGMVAELQAEPWFSNGESPQTTSLARQEETLSPERLRKNIDYVTHIGVSRTYLWGAEWWYWVKTIKGDSRYWDIVKDVVK